ncbi:MAG: hypothetical protein ACE37F_04635 [Nannocystaceae bacterium]|nr:hypothetical protein [bacterium]
MMRLLIALSTVLLAAIGAWLTPNPAQAKKICMEYPMSRYNDASPRAFTAENNCNSDDDCDSVAGAVSATCEPNACVYDFGEDLGRSDTNRKARYILAQVYRDNGNLAWVGYATKDGCTGNFSGGGGPFRLRTYSVYQSTVTDTRFSVKECSGYTPLTCQTSVSDLTDIDMVGLSTVTVLLDPSAAIDAFIPMSNALTRLAENVFGTWVDFDVQVGRRGCNGSTQECGAATDWPSGTLFPRITLPRNQARAKFNTVHEMTHAIELDLLGTTSGVLDCSNGSSDHTMRSVEYNSCANTEGLAHYVAAAAWNNLGNNANGHFVFFGDLSPGSFNAWDIESGTDEISAQCSSSCCGLGTEYDWARFYWDFRTNSGVKPSNLDPLFITESAHPYAWAGSDNCSPGHYSDIEAEAQSQLSSSLFTRWVLLAAANGVDN